MADKFFNQYEKVTYEKLLSACQVYDATVFSKVRLADILPVNKSGLSDSDFKFSLQAHSDFVVVSSKNEILFCVEFDGPSHNDQRQAERDARKNQLFKKFNIPLLRINARYLDTKYRNFDLLSYFIDIWFLQQEFSAMQARGEIANDEVFDPAGFLSNDNTKFPYIISLDAQLGIKKLYKQNRIPQPLCSCVVELDLEDNYHCIAWIYINSYSALSIKTSMRNQLFPGVDISMLLPMISTCEIYESIKKYFDGNIQAFSLKEMFEREKIFRKKYTILSEFVCRFNEPMF